MTRFAAVGLASFTLDTALVLLLSAVVPRLAVAVVIARILSGAANFILNRSVVFDGSQVRLQTAALRYVAVAVVMLGLNYLVLSALVSMGVTLLWAKVATDATLLGLSYAAQRGLVFAVTAARRGATPPAVIGVGTHTG